MELEAFQLLFIYHLSYSSLLLLHVFLHLVQLDIALLLNAGIAFINIVAQPTPVYAGNNEMKITDVRSTWPIEIKITNWPNEYQVKQQ